MATTEIKSKVDLLFTGEVHEDCVYTVTRLAQVLGLKPDAIVKLTTSGLCSRKIPGTNLRVVLGKEFAAYMEKVK
jgi:hypothetical protein